MIGSPLVSATGRRLEERRCRPQAAAILYCRITASCTHIREIEHFELPAEIAGCEECLAQGMSWQHLRMCQICGHIGCCDNSPGKHATAHSNETGHPIIRSAERGEDWSWCYVDQALFRVSPPPAAG